MALSIVPTAASSTPSSNLLPTVSASDLLRELNSEEDEAAISTGVHGLDIILQGGFSRGKTTEIWGAKGSGKSAIALTAAIRAVKTKKTVVWAGKITPFSISMLTSAACATPISTHRLMQAIPADLLSAIHLMAPPSLSHLLAFILHCVDNPMLAKASLLVIDDLSMLVDFDYPRQTSFATSSESEARKWQAGRRTVILASIVTALNKIANLHRLAVVVTNGCATSMRSDNGMGTAIVPAIGGSDWEGGIWNRLAVFQDFNGRFIAVQRLQGSITATRTATSPVLVIELAKGLLVSKSSGPPQSSMPVAISQSKKRTYEEIADSEDDEDYGWDELGSPIG